MLKGVGVCVSLAKVSEEVSCSLDMDNNASELTCKMVFHRNTSISISEHLNIKMSGVSFRSVYVYV